MSGAIPPLLPYAFTAWTVKLYLYLRLGIKKEFGY
jgi:hypothetical protein